VSKNNDAKEPFQVGYARVSTLDQNHDLQLDALREAGCERTFTESISGAKTNRPELQKALEYLRPGDTIVVWKLDRLGRNLKDLITIVGDLEDRGIGFKCITQSAIDTTTPMGKLVFHIFAALAEFEREVLRERVQAGLKAARARGRMGGRPAAMTPKKLALARQMNKDGASYKDIAETIGVHRTTVALHLKK